MDGPYTRYPRTTLWLLREGELRAPDGQVNGVDAIYIGKAPITNEQYEVFAPNHRRADVGSCDDDPVVAVSYHEAAGYCAWYAERTGKPFRLPTEIEWEYACRADSDARFFFGEDPADADLYVWHQGNSDGRLHPIETRRANDFGLFDTLGSVWEWTAPQPHEEPALRGGSFRVAPTEMSSDMRRQAAPDLASDDIGFRIVRSLR